MMNKNWRKAILAAFIFCASVLSYYYPVYKKGYPAGADYENLIRARNFSVAGTYVDEGPAGVLLSSKDAKQLGVKTGVLNPLTPMIYGQIFKHFGFKPNLPFYISIVLFSVFNVVLFFIVAGLFSLGVGFIAGIVSSFLPVMTVGATMGGYYEWAMLFLIIAAWISLSAKGGPLRGGNVRNVFASLFFALAALARNAFAISFLPFAAVDFYLHRSFKRTLIFILPFLVVFVSTLTPYSWLGVPNGYSDTVTPPFAQVGHIFDDPYSYYFNKDNYLAEHFPPGTKLNRVAVLFLGHFGFSVGIKDRFLAYLDSAKFYITEAFQITNFGGPVIIALIILGMFSLYRKNSGLLRLFACWFIIWLGYLIFSTTGNWDHYLEIIAPILILAALGFESIMNLVKSHLSGAMFKVAAPALLLLLIIQLSQSSFWRLHDTYRSSYIGPVIDLSSQVNKTNLNGSYAADIHSNAAYAFNYYTNKNIIYFNSDTVSELIGSGKLREAFGLYNVKAAIGYPSDTSSSINKTLQIPVFPWDKNSR